MQQVRERSKKLVVICTSQVRGFRASGRRGGEEGIHYRAGGVGRCGRNVKQRRMGTESEREALLLYGLEDGGLLVVLGNFCPGLL